MSLIVFIVAVAAVAAVGALFEPGEWYGGLVKPQWTPPSWLFAPVWSLLYVAIAVAGWRVWRSEGADRVRALQWWGAQLALNALWSWLFFGLHLPWIALLDLCLLVVCIAGFMSSTWRQSRMASWLFAPYLLWVLFAGALNLAIALAN
jgi:tryptophan-rich sensory protein